MATATRVTPTTAEVLLGLAQALDWEAEKDERRLAEHWWAERRMSVKVGSEQVGMALGRFEIHETESEWCDACGTLEHKGTHYRTVPWGVVTGIGRVLGRLAKQGLVERDEKYRSLWMLTADGAALVDDAQEIALAHIREAVG